MVVRVDSGAGYQQCVTDPTVEPTDGSCDIADGVRRERKKGSGERILIGEEDLWEDKCGLRMPEPIG